MITKLNTDNQSQFKRPGSLESVFIVLTNSKCIRPILGLIAITTAEIFTSFLYPSKNIYFKAKGDDYCQVLEGIVLEKYFEGFIFASSMNRTRIDLLNSEKEAKSISNMQQRYYTVPYAIRKKVTSISENNLKKPILDGICFGIMIDIAKKYLIDDEKIPTVIIENQKGALTKAAANQALYDSLKTNNLTYEEIIVETMRSLETSKQSQPEDPFYKAAFIRVLEALTVVDEDVAVDTKRFPLLQKAFTPRIDDPLFELMIVEKLKAEEAYRFGKTHPWLSLNNKGLWVISSPSEFKRAAAGCLDSTTLDWLEGILELRLGMNKLVKAPQENVSLWDGVKKYFNRGPKPLTPLSTVSNTKIREALRTIGCNKTAANQEKIIFHCRGLAQKSVENILGNHFMYGTDEEFLTRIPLLPVGFYSFSFSTGASEHVVSYIKTKEGMEFILDPNGMQLISTSPTESIYLFKKLLGLYELPKGEKKHNIRMEKIVPADYY